MRSSFTPWLLGITLAISPMAAFAQQQPKQYPECTAKPTKADVSGAKGAFQAGQGSFNEGDYARAITYWEDAFGRDCTAVALLLNLARAYELNGQKPEAVNALKTYIKRKPDSPGIDQIRRRIKVLNQKISGESAKPGPTMPGVTASGGAPPAATAPGSTAPPSTTRKRRSFVPLIVAGAGGVLGITGLIGNLVENGKVNDYESKCPINSRGVHSCGSGAAALSTASAAKSAITARNVWTGVAVVGGVVAVGGVVWYFLQPSKTRSSALDTQKQQRTVVVPELGPGYAGLSLSGAF